MKFRVIQGCPAPVMIAPYIALLAGEAHAEVGSIYRGDDARAILNRHGKHSQSQLYNATPAERAAWGIEGQPNRPGHSTHELKSDGVAYPGVPDGHQLEDWQQGFDVRDGDVARLEQAAARHGWELFRPYSAGVEFHHLNFRHRPHLRLRDRAKIIRLRATLPRR